MICYAVKTHSKFQLSSKKKPLQGPTSAMKREVLIFGMMSLVSRDLAIFLGSTIKIPQWRPQYK